MRKILVIFMLVVPFILPAQEKVIPDSELWTGFTYKLNLSKNWRAEAEQQVRFNNDYRSFKQTFTELGLRYEVTKFFELKGQYRYTLKNANRNESRLSLDAALKWDIDNCPLDIGYRARIQDTKVSYTGEKLTFLRNELSLDYNLTKLVDPFAAYESFYRFNDKQEFRGNRYTLGLEWAISKALELETFYRIDQEINVKEADLQHIIGLMLSYKGKL